MMSATLMGNRHPDDPEVYLDLDRAMATTNQDELHQLAQHELAGIRRAVARRPAARADTLDLLTDDSYYAVRVAVAKHPNTSSAALGRLAADPDRTVRRELARRSDLDDNLRILLALADGAGERGDIP